MALGYDWFPIYFFGGVVGRMTDPGKLPQDRNEHEQRELARLKRFRDGRSDAAPVIQYERGDL